MIRILIADDHPIVREGIKKLVDRDPSMSVVAECASGTQVLETIREVECDVAVIDLKMPGKGGLQLIEELSEQQPQISILILSMYPEDQFGVRALKAGACGYLSKDNAAEELLQAITRISDGGKYVSPVLTDRLVFDLDSQTARRPHETLSNREFEVLQLIASGSTVAEIAASLSLSTNTVNTYRRRILKKMGMVRSADLIRYALEHGLIV